MSAWLPHAIRAAGVLQLAVVAANLRVARVFEVGANLERCTPGFRGLVRALHSWAVMTVLVFAAIDLLAADALAGGEDLGRLLSAALAALWAWRLGLQLFVNDRSIRRQHPVADVAFTLLFLAVMVVHVLAALATPLEAGGPP